MCLIQKYFSLLLFTSNFTFFIFLYINERKKITRKNAEAENKIFFYLIHLTRKKIESNQQLSMDYLLLFLNNNQKFIVCKIYTYWIGMNEMRRRRSTAECFIIFFLLCRIFFGISKKFKRNVPQLIITMLIKLHLLKL